MSDDNDEFDIGALLEVLPDVSNYRNDSVYANSKSIDRDSGPLLGFRDAVNKLNEKLKSRERSNRGVQIFANAIEATGYMQEIDDMEPNAERPLTVVMPQNSFMRALPAASKAIFQESPEKHQNQLMRIVEMHLSEGIPDLPAKLEGPDGSGSTEVHLGDTYLGKTENPIVHQLYSSRVHANHSRKGMLPASSNDRPLVVAGMRSASGRFVGLFAKTAVVQAEQFKGGTILVVDDLLRKPDSATAAKGEATKSATKE